MEIKRTERELFTGQTKSTVKTNNETLELPLLITKATTSLLVELDWTAGNTPQHQQQ